MKRFSFQGVADKTEGNFAERKPLLQERSPCFLGFQLKHIWFSELAWGVTLWGGDAGGPTPEADVMPQEAPRCQHKAFGSRQRALRLPALALQGRAGLGCCLFSRGVLLGANVPGTCTPAPQGQPSCLLQRAGRGRGERLVSHPISCLHLLSVPVMEKAPGSR